MKNTAFKWHCNFEICSWIVLNTLQCRVALTAKSCLRISKNTTESFMSKLLRHIVLVWVISLEHSRLGILSSLQTSGLGILSSLQSCGLGILSSLQSTLDSGYFHLSRALWTPDIVISPEHISVVWYAVNMIRENVIPCKYYSSLSDCLCRLLEAYRDFPYSSEFSGADR
jgi:hypothetical protein